MHSTFAASLSIVLFVVIDLEFSCFGLFNPDPTNGILAETLQDMH